jgi:hypothetical protein
MFVVEKIPGMNSLLPERAFRFKTDPRQMGKSMSQHRYWETPQMFTRDGWTKNSHHRGTQSAEKAKIEQDEQESKSVSRYSQDLETTSN